MASIYNYFEQNFGSMGELIDFCENTPRAGGWVGENASNDWPSDMTWAMGTTLATALSMARFGWPEGREAFVGHMIDAKATGAAVALQQVTAFHNDVMGILVDVGAYMAGAPDNMIMIDEQAMAPAPVVVLNVGLGYSGETSSKAVHHYGAAICLLIESLQLKGHSVEVNMVRHNSKKGDIHSLTVNVKGANEPMDIDKLAFALAHPAMLRRIAWRALETVAGAFKNFGWGYGKPLKAPSVNIPSVVSDAGNFSKACNTMAGACKIVAEIWAAHIQQQQQGG